jgi:hypothetical protein
MLSTNCSSFFPIHVEPRSTAIAHSINCSITRFIAQAMLLTNCSLSLPCFTHACSRGRTQRNISRRTWVRAPWGCRPYHHYLHRWHRPELPWGLLVCNFQVSRKEWGEAVARNKGITALNCIWRFCYAFAKHSSPKFFLKCRT